MADASQLGDLRRRELQPHQAEHLRVAVLLDDVDARIPIDEVGQLRRERIGAQAQVRGGQPVFAFAADRGSRRWPSGCCRNRRSRRRRRGHLRQSVSERACAPCRTCERAGPCCSRSRPDARCIAPFSLWPDPRVKYDGIWCREYFGRESRRRRHPCSGPTPQSGPSVALSSTLPRSSGRSGYSNVVDIASVHAEIEIAHHEDEGLQPLGEIERIHRHRVALFNRRRDEHHVLRVTVRQRGNGEEIALRRSCRQPRRWPHPLNVEDDAWALRRNRRARRTLPSARCRVPKSRSWLERQPSLRRRPCQSPQSRPQPGRSRTSPCPVSGSWRYFFR